MEFYSREIQIMRQSQSKIALEFVSTMGVQVTIAQLQQITDVFVECCLRPLDEDLKEKVKNLDKWLATKKKEQDGKK